MLRHGPEKKMAIWAILGYPLGVYGHPTIIPKWESAESHSLGI